jgi:two-component system, chemotaxis family, protein-glutamate methylesterase/glutaminase
LTDFGRLLFGARQPSAPVAPRAPESSAIRVAIVDDSVVIRGLVSRWLSEDPELQVVGSYRTGVDAIAGIARTDADVVILDIEMPDMDGITALPLILKVRPGIVVIMASTLTVRHADISIRCLALGATDYIAKPSTNREVSTSQDFRGHLIERVKALSPQRRRKNLTPADFAAKGNVVPLRVEKPVPIVPARRVRTGPLRSIMVGASTGGPQAIGKLLEQIKPLVPRVPVLIAQHMPPMFTAMFAEHLRKNLAVDAVEAVDGEPLRPGRILIAPGGRHLVIEPFGPLGRARITDDAPVNFCRPSVDVLYESVARVHGADTVAVTLTGMGSDGAKGAQALAETGATIIAQDEDTSVVWGMPGAVARTGICNAILPLDKIGDNLATLMRGVAA